MDALLFGWYTRGRKVVNGNDKDGKMHETERDARVSRVIERVRLREEVCARPVAYGTVRYRIDRSLHTWVCDRYQATVLPIRSPRHRTDRDGVGTYRHVDTLTYTGTDIAR